MILTFFHSLLLGIAFIDSLLAELLAGYNNCLDTSSTDETLRPFSSINNHGNEDGIPNDSGLQHLESSMLNPDKQKENDKHGQGGKSQHEVIKNGASISTYSFNPAELEHYVPIQNTKNKRKRNEERNDGHSMMEKNVLAIYNDMAVKEQASIKRVHGSNTS